MKQPKLTNTQNRFFPKKFLKWKIVVINPSQMVQHGYITQCSQ